MLVRVFVEHFADSSHHQVHENTSDDVDQDDRWPRQVDGLPSPQKEPRTNSPSDGNNLNVAVSQAPIHAIFRRLGFRLVCVLF